MSLQTRSLTHFQKKKKKKNTVRDPGVRLRTNVFIFSWIYINFISIYLIKISHMVIEPGHNLT